MSLRSGPRGQVRAPEPLPSPLPRGQRAPTDWPGPSCAHDPCPSRLLSVLPHWGVGPEDDPEFCPPQPHPSCPWLSPPASSDRGGGTVPVTRPRAGARGMQGAGEDKGPRPLTHWGLEPQAPLRLAHWWLLGDKLGSGWASEDGGAEGTALGSERGWAPQSPGALGHLANTPPSPDLPRPQADHTP